MLLHCLIYVLYRLLCEADCATFYMDDGDQQSLPFSVRGQRMEHFRAQMLNLMGLKKPSGDVKVGDKFASRFMSMLYKEISQFESELRFNPNFRFFDTEESVQPNFDYKKVEASSHASDTIISFVPKRLTRVPDAGQLYELVFEFSATEFQNLRLIGAELYFILEGGADKFPLKSADVLVKGVENSHSYRINFDEFSSSGDYTFFSLNISRLLSFWPTFADPTAERKLWIEFLNVNGSEKNATAIDLPKMHCFGVGFFVEGEHEIMKRVRRSFAAFEVEENWDEDEEDAEGEENDDKSAAHEPIEKATANSVPQNFGGAAVEHSGNTPVGGSSEGGVQAAEEIESKSTDSGANENESVREASDASSSVLMSDDVEDGGIEMTNLTSNSSSNDSSVTGGISSKLGGAESFIRAASPKFGASSGFRRHSGNRRCRVRSLYVDFKDLGWDGWVIAPTGYQADYCDGDCSFPLDVSVNPTNHAIVQALVHLFDEKRAQPAKCAPIAMRAQSLLFFNNEKNVVMRRYQNMRVKQCGCR